MMPAEMRSVVRLEGTVQRYAWGSRSAIPALQGRAAADHPEAELWLGAHPKSPAQAVTAGGTAPLDRYVAEHAGEILGERVRGRFGALPFLLKYLAAEQALSVQCHPNAAQAQDGFSREDAASIPRDAPERSYRDSNPKPELIVSRGRFEALCGFRPLGELRDLLRRLAVPTVERLAGPLDASFTPRGLSDFYQALMRLPPLDRAALASAVAERARRLAPEEPAFAWVARLAEDHPQDVGILSPLLLNHVILERDEALFLGAGVLHAYLCGEGVELMSSSDNVVRGGLTDKHVDVPELLGLLSFEPGPPDVLHPRAVAPGVFTYDTPAEHFALDLLRPDSAPIEAAAPRGPEILMCLGGALTVEAEGSEGLQRGQAVLLTAHAGAYRIFGEGEAVRARVPDSC